jgi:hypothetical protein
MKNDKLIRVAVLSVIMLSVGFSTLAQEIKKTPYFINLNTADGTRIHELRDEMLSVHYTDAYGRNKEILMTIYNWKRDIVTTLSLNKVYGLNSFIINLREFYTAWEFNQVYVCQLKDESGRQYELDFKIIPPSESPIPTVDIVVAPEQMSCDNLTAGNLVNYYSDIKGGKAPYIVDWYVINSSRTDFLYQPREEVIATADKTTMITVDKNPSYYVMLLVKDACGNTQQKIVNLVCEDARKKISSIFIEELNSPLFNGLKSHN